MSAPAASGSKVAGQLDDAALVAAVRAGDDRAFAELFDRYQAQVATYVEAMIRDHGHSEDITQEVFMAALRSLHASQRPIAFKPWIYEIARNACIDRYRRSLRAQEVASGGERQLGGDVARRIGAGPTPETVADVRERFRELCQALGELSATDRGLLVMREFEGRSYREIVERSGMTIPAVESALFRARRHLIERYAALLEEAAPVARGMRERALLAATTPGRAVVS